MHFYIIGLEENGKGKWTGSTSNWIHSICKGKDSLLIIVCCDFTIYQWYAVSRDRIKSFKLMTAATRDILSSPIFTNLESFLVRWTCSASDEETLETTCSWKCGNPLKSLFRKLQTI